MLELRRAVAVRRVGGTATTELGLDGYPVDLDAAWRPGARDDVPARVPVGQVLNGIFKSFGFNNVYNGRITARVISGTGRPRRRYGSVIDENRTTDPTYVPSR